MTGALTVSGTVTYDFVPATYDPTTERGTLDFARATRRPVRNGQVRVLEGTRVLATTTTSNTGAYSLSFTAQGAGALTVQAVARTATPSILVQDNTANGAVWAISAAVPVGGGTRDLHATHGWNGTTYVTAQRTAAPFAILDSMYGATLALRAARPAVSLPALKVNWSPKNTTDPNGAVKDGFLGSSYFDYADNQIYVVGKSGDDTDEYDRHVIVHEWAHFFEANASRADSLGGEHGTGDVLDPRGAFGEGWGNAASALLTGDPLYVDSFFDQGAIGTWGFDLETDSTPTDDPTPNAFSESSVMRFLYDAADSTNEGFDGLSLGLGPLVDAFMGSHRTTNAFTTIASFITSLKAVGGVRAAGVDALAGHYDIGAITSDFGDGDPALRAMYVDVTSMPRTQSVSLDGRVAFNTKAQNRYFVVRGTGAQVTVSATSAKDVAIVAYRQGAEVAGADDYGDNATETFSFRAAAGATYVINLVGYGEGTSTYAVTMSITSP